MAFGPLAQTFYFDSFRAEAGRVVFEYSTDAEHHFTHEITHAFPVGVDSTSLAPALFAFGMAELAHYWKAILAPKIVVRVGALNTEQVAFWENLYRKGLGEFFFKNQIDFRDLIHIESAGDAPQILPTATNGSGALVPFGGGKDSLVTAELLKAKGVAFSWFEIEPLSFAPKLQEVSGVTSVVRMERNAQKNFAPIVELVKSGAPNGHVPISATYMLSAVLAAKACGYSDVVMSLERSANFGNTEYLGQEINHQYSKSFEFEQAIQKYVHTYIDPSVTVFSLLRRLYEIQIVQRFVEYPQYFPYFISCNKGLKTTSWCGACAKCAFIFATLSAFLPPETVVTIFKKNLFEDESLVPLYVDMIGKGGMKPFDCVGTFEENHLALYLAGEQYRKAGTDLPIVLRSLPIAEGEAHMHLLTDMTDEHVIPPTYA